MGSPTEECMVSLVSHVNTITLTQHRQLGKSSKTVLGLFVEEIYKDKDKMTVLQLLTEQMVMFFETGTMSETIFLQKLDSAGLAQACQTFDHKWNGLGVFGQDSQRMGGKLRIVDSGFEFEEDSLTRFQPSRWLNDEVIIACLHLSNMLSFVRVGFSIPIHQQTRSQQVMPRPFEKAAKHIARWREKVNTDCLFYFFLSSYMKIISPCLKGMKWKGASTTTTRSPAGENMEIKVCKRPLFRGVSRLMRSQEACEREFPKFEYVEAVCFPEASIA